MSKKKRAPPSSELHKERRLLCFRGIFRFKKPGYRVPTKEGILDAFIAKEFGISPCYASELRRGKGNLSEKKLEEIKNNFGAAASAIPFDVFLSEDRYNKLYSQNMSENTSDENSPDQG
ncbi:MAG TPA: hypothetical protein PKA63_03305 [Oligoflexia bacterium]|nr:hypothetical protein [Oligoflexia bacterium]HMP47682.1 hypothetical protein [Oligoflexia bacterium]